MEIGSRIKEHRMEPGLSQDDLAEKMYVSRQTISNWETGRACPDVQSPLLLSTIFGTTTDSFIEGDVEAMVKVMDEAARRYHRIATTAVVSAAVAIVVMLVSMGYLGKLQKEHDLATYREILAFSRGESADRDTERGRRERAMKPCAEGARTLAYMLIGAVCVGVLGVGLAMLVKAIA